MKKYLTLSILLCALVMSNATAFAQQGTEKLTYAGGYQEFHSDIEQSVIDLMLSKEKHGYFFLLYEMELTHNKILKITLTNEDSSSAFMGIANIIKATQKKWSVSGKQKQTVIIPIIMYDLRGECTSDIILKEWFSGDAFKKSAIKNCYFIPPLVVGFSKRI